jgi:hypothetical protein
MILLTHYYNKNILKMSKNTWSISLTEEQYKKFDELAILLYQNNKITQPKKNKVIHEYLLIHKYNDIIGAIKDVPTKKLTKEELDEVARKERLGILHANQN